MNTPTLDAVSDALRDALDDTPGAGSDMTPPIGAILAAIGPRKVTRRETPIRDLGNPWVCSVWFRGEGAPSFLIGNAGTRGGLTFTTKGADAMHAQTRGWFTFGWPALITSHAVSIGKRPVAVVHRLDDAPEWKGTAAALPGWADAKGDLMRLPTP